jgi:aryl-alcohol dehydrogenase-like predicted oxidoreductase
MQYARLGKTGLEVSRICLGCMTFGEPERGNHTWTLREDESRPIIKRAIELGINFLDTANVYSDGTSEEFVGRAIKDFARRDEIVLATKVHGRMRKGANGAGLSRKAILSEIDHSLKRLGTDYVDLYQIHRWDPKTPIEETLDALNDVVKSRQGALYRRVVHVCVAVQQGALCVKDEWLGLVRFDAEPSQSSQPRGRA